MTSQKLQTIAGKAVAESGIVLLDGPDGVAVAMTAECANATARQLADAARVAFQQRTAVEES